MKMKNIGLFWVTQPSPGPSHSKLLHLMLWNSPLATTFGVPILLPVTSSASSLSPCDLQTCQPSQAISSHVTSGCHFTSASSHPPSLPLSLSPCLPPPSTRIPIPPAFPSAPSSTHTFFDSCMPGCRRSRNNPNCPLCAWPGLRCCPQVFSDLVSLVERTWWSPWSPPVSSRLQTLPILLLHGEENSCPRSTPPTSSFCRSKAP